MKSNHTLLNTPVIDKILYGVAILCMKISGWKKSGDLPDEKKFVIIAAPHTTNWDMPITLIMAFAYKADIHWFGKDSLFPFPLKKLMMWLGGIPIDRSKNTNTVDAAAALFDSHEKLVLAIPPEGTRKKVTYWKTGFYHIALKANVPIACGFLDYKTKRAGFGPTIYPTGNIEEDMKKVKEFYNGIEGKYPTHYDTEGIKFKTKK